MTIRLRFIQIVCLVAGITTSAQAHVGSPDVYLESQAGSYKLFVTIRMPTAIPGAAQLEIRSETPGVREIRAVPLPMSGPGARFAPVPDTLKATAADPQFFTGTLWMMTSGSWQVKLSASGDKGTGTVAVPVPSVATSTKTMRAGLGAMLSLLMVFLVLGMVAIVGASVREAKLPRGAVPNEKLRRRGQIAMAISFVVIAAVIWYGKTWWSSEAESYNQNIYKPLNIRASTPGNLLTLTLSEPGWLESGALSELTATRTIDDCIPDHGHLMHLYVLREPGLDVVYHLHPGLKQAGVFTLDLPSLPAGKYKLYADIVHQSGFPETLVTTLDRPNASGGRMLSGDDASATTMPWSQSQSRSTTFPLPDGYRMQWVSPATRLRAKTGMIFTFRLVDPKGESPKDMALYMGMLGHAAFVKTDGSVFAHIHPTGTVSMAAFMKAQGDTQMESMPSMNMPSVQSTVPNQVTFPYGLPKAGRYRAFVQMKHGETVETGVFDMDAY